MAADGGGQKSDREACPKLARMKFTHGVDLGLKLGLEHVHARPKRGRRQAHAGGEKSGGVAEVGKGEVLEPWDTV